MAFGRKPPTAVRPAIQESLVHERPFQFPKGTRIDCRLVAELPGQRVEVDVVHRRARIALRQLLGKLLQLGDVGQRVGRLFPFRAGLSPENSADPVQSSPGRAERRCESSRESAVINCGEPKACWDSASNSARCSAVRLLRNRSAAAARFGK